MPLISIIIPVYNVEKYIGKCLDSLLNQSLKDIEIIAIDDCGMDGSIDIVKHYAASDSRIKLLLQEKNSGPMVAREIGYRKAQGDYIFFCDSDDTLPDNALQLLYNVAIEKNADLVIGRILLKEIDGTERLWCNEYLEGYGTDFISVYKALIRAEISHNLCGKLFKRGLLQDYDYATIPNMRNGEDALLFYQIVEHTKKVVTIPEYTYHYVQNSTSSTHIQIAPEHVDKIIDFESWLYYNIFRKYPEIIKIGRAAVVTQIIYWWGATPYYSRKRFVRQIKNCNLMSLFSMKTLCEDFGVFGALKVYYKIAIEFWMRKLLWCYKQCSRKFIKQ